MKRANPKPNHSTPRKRPTVCIDCRYIRERPSGISVVVQSLVDYIPKAAPDLDFLLLKNPKGPERLSIEPNVREQVVKEEPNGPATLFWMSRLVDFSKVDVYHNPFNIYPYGMKIPTVVTLADVMWIKHPQWAKSTGWWGHVEVAFFTAGMWNVIRKADHIITISEATRKEIGTLDPNALSRVTVAFEGISDDFHPLEGVEGQRIIDGVKRRYLHSAARYILTVGQFAAYKNHETVLRAFAKAFGDQPDVHLALVQRLGKGPQVLRPIATQLGVNDRVHFLHNVPLLDLVALYNGAIALCHPSLYEGFGNPPAEALGCGCPVVTSNRSSMPEVSGEAAILVDPEDVTDVASALRKVAGDPAVRTSMRERGLARAKELTWAVHAQGCLDAYRKMLTSAGPPAP